MRLSHRRNTRTGSRFRYVADAANLVRQGAGSVVRKAIGAEWAGDAIVQRVQPTCIRAPDLIHRQLHERAWGTGVINPRRAGMVYAIDGRERWLVHNYLKQGEGDFDSVDRDACIRTILGVEADFKYDIISREDWYGRRLPFSMSMRRNAGRSRTRFRDLRCRMPKRKFAAVARCQMKSRIQAPKANVRGGRPDG